MFENIHLMPHRGGDSAHFIMWSLFRFCDGVGDQRWSNNPIHTDRNSYDGWESAVMHKDKIEFQKVDDAIESGQHWTTPDFYPIPGYTPDKKYIQQIHSFPRILTTSTVGETIVLPITVRSPDLQWRITNLDIIKQNGYMSNEERNEYHIVSAHVAAQFSQEVLYVPADGVRIHYIDYDSLFGKDCYKEFCLLAKAIDVNVIANADTIEDAFLKYSLANSEMLHVHGQLDQSKKKVFIDMYYNEIDRLQKKSTNYKNSIAKYRDLY